MQHKYIKDGPPPRKKSAARSTTSAEGVDRLCVALQDACSAIEKRKPAPALLEMVASAHGEVARLRALAHALEAELEILSDEVRDKRAEAALAATSPLPDCARELLEGEVAVRDTQALAKAAATSRVLNMKKLEDAEDAGGKNAAQCTLIVAEGDSAKAFADAGLEVVGRQRYGVFALRGKPLNVRDVSKKKLSENKELVNLMRALGLSPDGAAGKAGGKLRYGRLMLMTDQDNDGFHIKGLVISMIHHYWPALLASEFVQEFHTPLLKAKRLSDGRELSFFSLRDYDAWHAELEEKEAPRWRTKYYKGLGTSTDHEARTYFSQLPRHMVQLEWGGDTDGDLIDMAF